MRMTLTKRQADVLAFITDYISDNGGISPTYEEVRVGLGLNSKSMVMRDVEALVARGRLRHAAGCWRSLALVTPAAPKRLTTVDALIMVGSIGRYESRPRP